MTRRARQLMVVLLCLLAAQLVLGMTANFYARVPTTLTGVRGTSTPAWATPRLRDTGTAAYWCVA